MNWLKRRENKNLKELGELLNILEIKVSSLRVDVDSLILRVRKKIYFPKEEDTETSKYNDGFDDLRKLKRGT